MKDRLINNIKKEQAVDLTRKIIQLEETTRGYERRSTFFELLIRSLPGLFYAFDDKFQVHMWNKNVEKVTGYIADEIPEHSLFELFDGEDLKFIQDVIQNVFKTGEGVAEAILITKDGRRIPYFFTGVSAVIEGTPYLLGMGLDISILKGAEAALLESEALYRTFAARMTEGVTLIHEDKFVFVNNAFATMLGFSDPNDILGQDVMGLCEQGIRDVFQGTVRVHRKGHVKGTFFPGPVDEGQETGDMGRGQGQPYPVERESYRSAHGTRHHRDQAGGGSPCRRRPHTSEGKT